MTKTLEGEQALPSGSEPSPSEHEAWKLGIRPATGEFGAVLGAPGIGKSALLVHIAIEELLRGGCVLHLSQDHSLDHVREAYAERLEVGGFLRDREGGARGELLQRRIIEVTRRNVSPEDLEKSLRMLEETMRFKPTLVILDSLTSGESARPFLELLERRGASLWLALQPDRSPQVSEILAREASLLIELEPIASGIALRLTVARSDEPSRPLGVMDDHGFLKGWGRGGGGHSALLARQCTLYSGGAQGAETAFGEAAEAWGLKEINYTFDGHLPVRTRGLHVLNETEMGAGEVSLLYVSRRMNRSYRDGSHIRKVLQSLWHIVQRAQMVFVVGQIQEDDTVVGGTGWAVELARMWNKSLWVYDQGRSCWFHWEDGSWHESTPRIDVQHIAGTGTRHITDAARQAVLDLFKRSFE